MSSWGVVFNHHKAKGCDPSDAAYRADQWEKRQDPSRWSRCPSTHCERWQECRSPNECSAAKKHTEAPYDREQAMSERAKELAATIMASQEEDRLRSEIERLRAENERLRAENERLRRLAKVQAEACAAMCRDCEEAAARSMRERIKANLHWLSPEAHQMYIDALPLIEDK